LRLLFVDKNTSDKIAWQAFLNYDIQTEEELGSILDSLERNRPFLHECASKLAKDGKSKLTDVDFFSIVANQKDYDDKKFLKIYLTSDIRGALSGEETPEVINEMKKNFRKEAFELLQQHRPELYKEWFENK